MAYRPGSAAFNFTAAPYRPPKPLDFNFDGTPDIDIVPPPAITTSISARWEKSNAKDRRESCSGWQSPPEKQQATAAAWGAASQASVQSLFSWSEVERKELELSSGWSKPAQADAVDDRLRWMEISPKDSFAVARWDRSLQAKDMRRMLLAYRLLVPAKDAVTQIGIARTDELGRIAAARAEFDASLYIPNTQPAHFIFKGRQYTPPEIGLAFFNFRYVVPKYQTQPKDSRPNRVRWADARRVNILNRLRWGWGIPTDPRPTGIVYPDYDGPVIIIPDPESAGEPDIKETYMIPNSVAVTVLPDGTPLAADRFTLSLDIDSYSWSLDMQLFGRESMQLIKPDGSGQKNIQIVINGHTWVFLVTGYSNADKFPAKRFTVKGSSRTQLLGEPYAKAFSAVNAVDINARQTVEDLLQNTGFTLTWDSVNQNPSDWTISAGALSYTEQTPMQVASRIAESIGAVIKPHTQLDEFAIVPRYRDPVWHWSATLVDRIVPHQIVGDMAGEWSPRPEYNSCYVSGVSYGVAVDVRRAGTAGNEPAPDVYDELITSTDAARQRGIAEICKGGNQEVVTLTIPLFPADTPPGLIQPAMLCEVRPYNEANWRGLCLSTTINVVNYSAVHQQIKLERHHGNR